MSAIFAPITSILISRLTLVPAIRILYINAFVLMSVKILILYLASRETSIGKMRLLETKGKSILQLTGGYTEVIKIIFSSRGTVFSIIIAALACIVSTINSAFWQIIASRKLLVPESALPIFMVFRSVLAIIFLFFVIPKLSKGLLKIPLFWHLLVILLGRAC
uniref:Major facilitator superfamily MFS_1 n=1 Tax=uncultured bacterium contig00076 TaxID=1181554 RepID=A0A806KKQ8_9BACT|nr:major facilitator superfamily MFS_1 [uncultured bacterium contig00076]